MNLGLALLLFVVVYAATFVLFWSWWLPKPKKTLVLARVRQSTRRAGGPVREQIRFRGSD